MEIVNTKCPGCGRTLEFPRDFDNVRCAGCASVYIVREYKGTISLSIVEQQQNQVPPSVRPTNGAGGLREIEIRLAELDEEIATTGSEIEAIKSKEQSAPLQAGCAFFGMFGLVIAVLAVFATVARDYFGGWLFYIALAAVLVIGFQRMRRRLLTTDQLDELRQHRAHLQEALVYLQSERDRVQELKEKALSKNPEFSAGDYSAP
jgi:LSD1 subclass zinc finger protein